ncbi:MAG: hypothetical protein FJX52_16290 [Alphaproteobacteria bacterium]|nr:hypothetical protein [Alphaproteobacteria bacterium]
MSSAVRAVVAAAVAAVLVFVTGSVLLWAGDFTVLAILSNLVESLGILPNGWSDSHMTDLLIAGLVISLPPMVWFSAMVFRRALAFERDIAANPPAA